MKLVIYHPSEFAKMCLEDAGDSYGLPYGENDNEAWVESDDMDLLEAVRSDVDMEIGDDDGTLDIE